MKSLIHLVLVIGLISTFSCTAEEPVEREIRATLLSVTLKDAEGYRSFTDPFFELKYPELIPFYRSEYFWDPPLPVKWDDIDLQLHFPVEQIEIHFYHALSAGNRLLASASFTIEDIYPQTEVEILQDSSVIVLEFSYR